MLPAFGGPPAPSPSLAWIGPFVLAAGAGAAGLTAGTVTVCVPALLLLLLRASPKATDPTRSASAATSVLTAVPIWVQVICDRSESVGGRRRRRRGSSSSGAATRHLPLEVRGGSYA